jgi:hypothetical protein
VQEQQVVEVKLANGATALARVTAVDGIGATKTSALDSLDFDAVGETLEGVVESIRSSLAKVTPDRVSVSLGIELAVKAGKLTGLIVDGEGKGSIGITLEWEGAKVDD